MLTAYYKLEQGEITTLISYCNTLGHGIKLEGGGNLLNTKFPTIQIIAGAEVPYQGGVGRTVVKK